MGKIRVSTIGDESAEKEQKEALKKRKEAKRAEKSEQKEVSSQETKQPQTTEQTVAPASTTAQSPDEKVDASEKSAEKKQKKEKFKVKKASPRSSKYNSVSAHVDKNKVYTLKDALELLPKLKTATFDETVELHINTIETGVNGTLTLPHGTGKKTRVAIVNAAKDAKGLDDLIKRVESGEIDFDVLVATPDSMPRLAKIARYLGPKGLMPNPKNGTVSPKPEEIAKKFEGGQMSFKTEAKAPIIHLTVGKSSFGADKLSENIKTALKAVQTSKMKSVTLKSTMSPGIKLDFSAL